MEQGSDPLLHFVLSQAPWLWIGKQMVPATNGDNR